ncbi:MAG TPA: lysophospholipid acyltransferase family protein [Acidimicrobiia bacterium]|nr:lysophospholipid acyltransferase family protein [Acidimicrobiia bacterium]
MPDNPLARRSITVTAVVALFVALTILSPLLVLFAAIHDLTRRLTRRRPAMALRLAAFLWVYLLGEVWAVTALAVTAPLPPGVKMDATFRLQDKWAGWNLAALRRLFSVEFRVDGQECLLPGPIVVLSRHASIVDTLLPARFVARAAGLRLRYVLKKELLADPALDIAGNRLRNAFIDRASRDVSERNAIEALAADLGLDDGIVIYPEGTRFTAAKLDRSKSRAARDSGPRASAALGFRRVLPPKPGGTLTILETTRADVVVLAHTGLEGLATIKEIWRGDLVGSRVAIGLWRVPHEEIPSPRSDRIDWLYRLWAEVDEWVGSATSSTRAHR